jgi:hypothetical protein
MNASELLLEVADSLESGDETDLVEALVGTLLFEHNVTLDEYLAFRDSVCAAAGVGDDDAKLLTEWFDKTPRAEAIKIVRKAATGK